MKRLVKDKETSLENIILVLAGTFITLGFVISIVKYQGSDLMPEGECPEGTEYQGDYQANLTIGHVEFFCVSTDETGQKHIEFIIDEQRDPSTLL